MGRTSPEFEVKEALNRNLINRKIVKMRECLQDVEESHERVIGVLDASAENYSLLNPRTKRAARDNLFRFDAVLDCINLILNGIEEDLAMLELAGVEIGTNTRAIKTQISSFSKIIASLITILNLDVPMDEAKVKAFTAAKEELFNKINEVQLILERRE